jgi:hypothetical protein
MQKSALLLGHPTYSIAATLCTLLLASGLGSAWGSKLQARPRWVRVGLRATVAGCLYGLAAWTAPAPGSSCHLLN